MSEGDGTVQSGPTQMEVRPSQRRVTSAPVGTIGTLITPSPSPSPNSKKMELMVCSLLHSVALLLRNVEQLSQGRLQSRDGSPPDST